MAKQHSAAAAQEALNRPPRIFTALRWSLFVSTVAIAIGMLAMLDKHLTSIRWVYDGPDTKFKGRSARILFCLLSPSSEASSDTRCDFSFASASVSLAASLIWSYIQVLRRNPFKHRRAKFADLGACALMAAFVAVAAVLLSIWTHDANTAGLPQRDWRGGLCTLAWALFVCWALLATASAFLVTTKSQGLFNKWDERQRRKRDERELAKAQKMQAQAAAAEHAAAGAAQEAARVQRAAAAAAAAAPVAAAAHAPHTPAIAGAVHASRAADRV